MTLRKRLLELLTAQPRSVSSLARELGLPRRDLEENLHHMIRSARAAGHSIIVVPAKCRACGFAFGAEKLTRPGKCPACHESRIFEPQIKIES